MSNEQSKPQRKPSKSGQATKDKILDAALATVRDQGLTGTSARSIAKTGEFNQALVFYHFDSVEGLLLAALQRAHHSRMERFEEKLLAVNDLQGLTRIGQELHASSTDPNHAALAAIVAGWSTTSELGQTVLDTLQPWNVLVSDALRRILGDHPLANGVPTDDLAFAVSALFLGLEILGRLDPTGQDADRVFTVLGALASLSGPMLASLSNQATGGEST